MPQRELEMRLSELESRDRLTEAEREELAQLRRQVGRERDDVEVATVRVGGPMIPRDLHTRLEREARQQHTTIQGLMLRASEAFLDDSEDRSDSRESVRELLELEKAHRECRHPEVRAEIVRRARRQFGIDLGVANEGGKTLEEAFVEYQRAGGTRYGDLDSWRRLTAEQRADALKHAGDVFEILGL